MNLSKLFLCCCLVVSTSSLLAGIYNKPKNGTVLGQVVDAVSGEPLTGALISLEGCNDLIFTDEQGYFRINLTEKAPESITISLVSFSSISMSAEQLTDGLTIPLSEK